MKEEYNIDKLFREKLEGFSEEPPSFVWDGIREQMAHGKRNKRIIWYRWSAVASLLVLAFLSGWYFNETSKDSYPAVTDTHVSETGSRDKTSSDEESSVKVNERKIEEPIKNNNAFLAGADDRKGTPKKDSQETNTTIDALPVPAYERERLQIPEMIEPVEAALYAQNTPVAEVVELTKTATDKSLSEFEKETIDRNTKYYAALEKKEAGWRMGLNLSPGYSSYRAKHGAAYASNMTHEASNGNASMSGGISVRYKAAKRWSIESGMYYAQNGQQTGSSPQLFGGSPRAEAVSSPAEQLFFNTSVKMESNHMAMNSTAGVIAIDNLPEGAEVAANLENTYADGNSLITQGELSQVFDLVEIPVYLRYLLFESVLDVELVGGINAGMVVGNNAYLDNQHGMQKIGSTRDISTVNFAGTLGVGVSYALGKQFSLAVEPRFNYYLNSLSKNPEVDFRPYRIGVYTGLYYNF